MAKSNDDTTVTRQIIRSNDEALLLRSILSHFRDSDALRMHRNHIGYDGRAKVKYGNGIGSPDVIGVDRGGRVIGIEVKSADGKLSDEQELWHKWAPKWGIRVCVVRTMQEAINFAESLT